VTPANPPMVAPLVPRRVVLGGAIVLAVGILIGAA